MSAVSFRLKKFFYFVCAASLGLIPWAVTHFGETNYPPQLPPVRYFILALYAVFFLGYFFFVSDPHIETEKLSGWVWMGLIAVFLSLTYPVFSADLMEYLVRGRILGIYHASPYRALPIDYPSDIFEPRKMFFQNNFDSYGPLSVYLQTLPALLFQNSIRGMIWAYKIMDAAFLFCAVIFFWKIARHLKIPNAGQLWAIFAYSPLLTVTALVDGHNDIIMMAFSVVSLYFLLRNQFGRAFFFWTCGFLIKYMVALQLPFMVLYAIKRKWEEKKAFPWIFVFFQTALNCALIAACFAPVWGGVNTFLVILRQKGAFYTNTVPYLFYLALHFLGLPSDQQLLKTFFLGAFFVFYAVLLWKSWRASEGEDPLGFFRLVALAYLAFYAALPSPMGYWYLSWALFWIVLARWPKAIWLVILYSAVGLLAFFKRINFLAALATLTYVFFLMAPQGLRAFRRK